MDENSAVRRAVATWLILLLLALAAAWTTVALVNKHWFSPGGEVRSYFRDLRAGEAGRALGRLGADVPDGADPVLLDHDPLRRAARAVTDLRITTVDRDDERAVVRADYMIDGQRRSTEFRLVPQGSAWGFVTDWRFEPSALPTLTVTAPGPGGVQLNGAAAAPEGSPGVFAALAPGQYTVSADSRWVDADPVTVVLTSPGEQAQVTLRGGPSQELADAVGRGIEEDLRRCTDQGSLYPVGCPFSHDFEGRVQGDVVWRITEVPRPEVSLPEDGGGVALSPAHGTAEVSFTAVDLLDGSTEQVTATVPFDYAADVRVDGDEVTVTRAAR